MPPEKVDKETKMAVMDLAVPNERLRTLPVVSSFIDYFPVLLRPKPLYLAQEILEQPAFFSADTLFELVESVLHRARFVELSRLAKFDAVN